ncbi:MAG TPA: MOSC domain-containing protein, partial [Ktedonobacterales bacterium]|nr:MOSC domain-containing protein [Ktedonobacterales bacterium]
EGHSIYPGAAGENITLSGIPLAALVPGVRLALGDEVIAEISGYAAPCDNIADFFIGGFTRISQKLHPGESRVYARTVREGTIQPGDRVQLLPADGEEAADGRERA